MPKLIIITGTPGTGKSALAKILARKLHFDRLNLHQYYPAISSGYSRKKQAYNIDRKKLIALVRKKLSSTKKGLIIDSHVSQHLPKSMVDMCIVLTCSDLKVLRQRLKQREYSPQKIRENLDAEIFQVCLMQAEEKGQAILVFDTSTLNSAAIAAKISRHLHQ